MPVLSFAMRSDIYSNTVRLFDIVINGDDRDAQELVRLLAAGVNLDVMDKKHLKTPLHYALDRGWIKVVKSLLPYYKDNLNHRDRGGRTPLYIAASKGYLEGAQEVVTLLLNAGADSQIGLEPIAAAERMGKVFGPDHYKRIIQFIKAYRAITPESILNPTPGTLKNAINAGLVSLVKQLLMQLILTVDELRSFGQDAKARFVETNDPVYKEIGRLLYQGVGEIRALMGTSQGGKGTRVPGEIGTTYC